MSPEAQARAKPSSSHAGRNAANELRQARGLSQKMLAEVLHVSNLLSPRSRAD